MRKKEILKKIDELLNSKEILDDLELKKIFINAKNSIENDGFRAVAYLSNDLSLYLVTHQYKAPSNVIEFASFIAKTPHQERGKGAFLKMLAMTFIGLK